VTREQSQGNGWHGPVGSVGEARDGKNNAADTVGLAGLGRQRRRGRNGKDTNGGDGMRNLKNAIGYIRVSTEAQAQDDRFGIEVQRREILAYADEHGYAIVDWKIDDMSGAKDDRPALNEILYGDNTTNPPFEAVIVFKNDRLARDTKLYFYYLYTLEKKNIKLLSTREEFAEGGDFANIYRALLQFVAEQERKNIAIRTGRGRSIKASCGGYSGGRCAYGYRVENGRLVINEDERPIVEFVFSELKKGTNKLAITEKLNEMGYRTRIGTRFRDSTIHSIANNEMLYRGYYRYGEMKNWVRGVHEPILKDDEEDENGGEKE